MQLNQKEQIRRMYKILFILKKKNKKQEKHNHIQRIPEDSFHLKYWFSNENSNTYFVKCEVFRKHFGSMFSELQWEKK